MSKQRKIMNKLLFITLISVLLIGCKDKSTFIKTVESKHDIATTVEKFKTLIESKGLEHFYTIDHGQNARNVEMNLKPEVVVVFGNPKNGYSAYEL